MKPTFALIASLLLCLITTTTTVARAQSRSSNDATATVPATVVADQTADLYSKLGGFLKEIHVDIGDRVEQGQLLAVLDVPEMEQQLLQKEARMEQAKALVVQANAKVEEAHSHLAAFEARIAEARTICETKKALQEYRRNEYDRLNQLLGQGAVQRELVDSAAYEYQAASAEVRNSQARIATAEANLAGARAAVRKAQADVTAAESSIAVAQADMRYTRQLMEYSRIIAPFSGEITKRMVDAGAFVQSAAGNSAAQPILQLVSTERLRVQFAVSMSAVSRLDRGDRVVLSRIDGMDGMEFEGTVSRFSAALDKESRMMRVEMDLDNANGELKPGYFGYVTVYLDE